MDQKTAPARALRSPAALIEAGLAAEAERAALERVAARYAVAVTPAMAALIDPADPADPIARQFVPRPEELLTTPEERPDPIGDHPHSPVPGIVHRHRDRVLLKLVDSCPVYCRFCFRREMVGPGGEGVLSGAELDGALDYIAHDPNIWEVVITGGDPMVVSPRRLADVTARLAAAGHVKILRLHSRVPVVDPARVTPALVEAVTAPGLATYVAVHANHARELTQEARAACDRLLRGGVSLVSQTVLLKGVNDDPDTLEALMRAFVEARVKPYYLHHPDLAPGTGHFRLSIDDGQAIMAALRGRLSGLAQPTYVLDIPGGYGKVPIGPDYVRTAPDGAVLVTDPAGRVHRYPR